MKTEPLADRAVPRRRDVSFLVDGRPVRAAAGETVAAAMLAEGERCFARRRGEDRALLCNMGTCFECAVTVDDVPLTRSCMTTVRDGMDVRTGE